MVSLVDGYGPSRLYDVSSGNGPVSSEVRERVDLVLDPKARAEERHRAYQLVQRAADRMCGSGGTHGIEDASHAEVAQLLKENGIPTVADPAVIEAIDAQIDGEVTDKHHRAAYELIQWSVDRAGGIGPGGIPQSALMLRVCQLLHHHGFAARFDVAVMQAVDSQIGPEATRGQRLHAYELLQNHVKHSAGKDYATLAGRLMRDHGIPTRIANLGGAMQMLSRDFAVFDTAYRGKNCGADGKVSIEDLQAVRDGGNRYTAEQRSLAAFLLRSDVSRNYLDVGAGHGDVDGTISREDLQAARSPAASGAYFARLLDAAAGRGGRDRNISCDDIRAALADPHVPAQLKDILRLISLAPEGPRSVHGFIYSLSPDEVSAVTKLYDSPQFAVLSPADKRLVGEIFIDSRGSAGTSNEIRKLIESPALAAMTAGQKSAALTRIAVVNTPEFRALPGTDRALVRDALANAPASNVSMPMRIKALLEDASFQELSAASKTAVLSQVKNYPNSRSTWNVFRLIQKDWFDDMSLPDQQRTLKLVAFASQYAAADQTIIRNTLDKLLAPNAPYEMDWDETGTLAGTALDDELSLNPAYFPAGNGPVSLTDLPAIETAVNTVPHEVNHLVNDVEVGETFEYFMDEYRAYFVGFRAQHGHDPSVNDMLAVVRNLLTLPDYSALSTALAAGDDESHAIVAFMATFLGQPGVTPANAATLYPAPGHGGTAAPAPTGNVDNH